jgi:hypothetical protein
VISISKNENNGCPPLFQRAWVGQDRTHGCEPTREAAMAAFAKSWRRK